MAENKWVTGVKKTLLIGVMIPFMIGRGTHVVDFLEEDARSFLTVICLMV